MNRRLNNINALIGVDFEMEIAQDAEEEELLMHLGDRVAELLENRPEYFFNLLYRLDVSEQKVHQVLTTETGQPVNLAIARLILDREKARLETRRKYSSKRTDDAELDF